jgi:hypothetical protein
VNEIEKQKVEHGCCYVTYDRHYFFSSNVAITSQLTLFQPEPSFITTIDHISSKSTFKFTKADLARIKK